jgi:hypothetical protein
VPPDPLAGSYETVASDPRVCLAGRGRASGKGLETWSFPLVFGQSLPTLPLWLSDDLAVNLDLEASYEETCRVLRIG